MGYRFDTKRLPPEEAQRPPDKTIFVEVTVPVDERCPLPRDYPDKTAKSITGYVAEYDKKAADKDPNHNGWALICEDRSYWP